MSYADILANFPGSDMRDEVAPEGGGMIYYNGLQTIKNKTLLAKKKAGGVMIWQLLHDAAGEGSLLMAIDKIARSDVN
jgi:hypothetical protein